MLSVPVVTVGVVMAVSTPVVGLIAYIDTVLLPELITYAKCKTTLGQLISFTRDEFWD